MDGRDEEYVLGLCDQALGMTAVRQHRFAFLRGDGDPGRCLPVDAYYPSLHLVLEYREKQHTESVTFWDGKPTKSGVPRGIQREIYDARRREVLPVHGIDLLEISYSELSHGANRRLRRESAEDLKVIRQKLARWIPAGPAG